MMKFSTTIRTLAVTGALVVGVAPASASYPGDAASHYTPRALKALGLQWEAKANFYGKQSESLRKKQAPAVAPISSSPPEGIESLPGDEGYSAPTSCSYTHDEPC